MDRQFNLDTSPMTASSTEELDELRALAGDEPPLSEAEIAARTAEIKAKLAVSEQPQSDMERKLDLAIRNRLIALQGKEHG